MSDIDPYAPVSLKSTKPAPSPAPETAPEKAPEAPVTKEQSVPEGSIKEVLGWVGEDATRAQAALDAETAGENRTSLISKLNTILN